jgi:hypothetical protein
MLVCSSKVIVNKELKKSNNRKYYLLNKEKLKSIRDNNTALINQLLSTTTEDGMPTMTAIP